MKNKLRYNGKMKRALWGNILLGLLLAVIDLYVYLQNITAGVAITIFLVFYFAVAITNFLNTSRHVTSDLISFATQYGQVQKQIMMNLDYAFALLDDGGRILWINNQFGKNISPDSMGKSITGLFPACTKDKLPGNNGSDEDVKMSLSKDGYEFEATFKKVALSNLVSDKKNWDVSDDYDGFIIVAQFEDVTALKLALKELDDQSLAVGLVYFDNYDEALEGVEEVRRSLLAALIERKVNKYMANLDGITKKLDKDKYMVILRKSAVAELKENRFDLLEDVKKVNIGNEMAVTLSIGIGHNGLSYAQNYEFARAAIDLALGRGGDQAVVKTTDQILYFGGKSQQVEKSTRVKARVKAHALMEIISAKEQVFIMGHRVGDVDSFGASVGVYRIAKMLDKNAHIVLNDVTASMKPLVDMFVNNPDCDSNMILNSQQALEEIGSNSVLVIVDVNKPSITECPELIGKCKSIVVLDHHRQSAEPIENATLSYVEPYASSTCEMVAEILQYTTDNIKITADEADSMYSGIMIDTNNFTQKTGVRTFEAAAFLRRNGVDVTRVRKLFRENVEEYKARADAVSQAEVFHDFYAISVCKADDCASPTVVGAQAANELLNIKGVRASFVFTYYQDQVFISARSIDEVNVQVIMEKLGGGGHMSVAGAQLTDISLEDAITKLKGILDTMISGGEL